MPYLAHFALATHPFGLTPNTEQYFPTANNTHILQSLQYAAAKRGGILKVVGDVGTGKTMLCRLLLRALMDNPETRGGVAYLNAPQADGEWLLAALCIEFGLSGSGNRAELMHRLNEFLVAAHAEGRTCIVVVDEAQALGAEGLETIRLLSNLETETAKLLQIVLFGQPEVDALLARPDLRQINQRIAFAFNTQPLSAPEVGAYVQHRIRCSRLPGVEFPVFTPQALALLARASRGVPRVVNILADKALLIAYGESAMPVTDGHVGRAIEDSRAIVGEIPKVRGRWGRRLLWGSIAVEAAVIASVLIYNPDLPRRALDLLTGETEVAQPEPAVLAPPAPAAVAPAPAAVAPAPTAAPAPQPAPAPAAPPQPVPATVPAAAPEAAAPPAVAADPGPRVAVSPPVVPAPEPTPAAVPAAAPAPEPAPQPVPAPVAQPGPPPAPAPAVPPVVPSSLAPRPAPAPAPERVTPAVPPTETAAAPVAAPAPARTPVAEPVRLVPVPDAKPKPPPAPAPVVRAAASAPAPAPAPASASAPAAAPASAAAPAATPAAGVLAGDATVVGRRMPDGSWRWE